MDEGYEIASYIVDLADRSAVYAAAEKVKKEVNFVPLFLMFNLFTIVNLFHLYNE